MKKASEKGVNTGDTHPS